MNCGIFIGALLAFTLLAGCKASSQPFAINNCGNAIVARDSFRVQFIEFDPKSRLLTTKIESAPSNAVIMTAQFHGAPIEVIYGTWKQASSSGEAELHFLSSSGRENTMLIKEGLNSIFPLPTSNEILIETAAIKTTEINDEIGQLSADEYADANKDAFRYLEDIVLDGTTRLETRRLHGTLARRDIKDGKMYAYATGHSIYEYDMVSGRRASILSTELVSRGTAAWHSPAYFSPVGGSIYAVTLDQENFNSPPSRKLHADRDDASSGVIYTLDQKLGAWHPVGSLGFSPLWVTSSSGVIICIDLSHIAIFDVKEGRFEIAPFPRFDFVPTALVRLKDGWAMSVAKDAHNPDRAAHDSEIWLFTLDFKEIISKKKMPSYGAINLYSLATPAAEPWH